MREDSRRDRRLAALPAVGLGTLRRLNGLDSKGHPVLSVYLDLDAARFPTRVAREEELERLITGVAEHADEADVRRVCQTLHRMAGFAHGTRGLAMFSSAGGSAFEAVPLPSAVEPMAVLDTAPWLEPLAGMFTRGDRAVAVVGRRAARLFRGGPGMLVEFAALHDELHRRHVLGDCSQLRLPGCIEEHVDEHARRLAELLLRAHRRRAFEEIVVIAPSELWSAIEAALHSDLRSRLGWLVELDLDDSPAQEIVRAVAQHLQHDPTEHCGSSTMTTLPLGAQAVSRQSTTRHLQRLPLGRRISEPIAC
jgi:hypothetical protein